MVSLSGFAFLISAQCQCDGKILDVWLQAMTGSDVDTVFCLNLENNTSKEYACFRFLRCMVLLH